MSETDNVLEAALSDAFSTSTAPSNRLDLGQQPANVSATSPAPDPAPETAAISASDDSHDEWKVEYDENVSRWREESAKARDKAEKTRQHWEHVRAAERADSPASQSKLTASWDTLASRTADSPSQFLSRDSPSPADARDLVSGEPSKSPLENHPTHSRQDTGDDSKWENVASEATSSFPSMTFPEPATSPSHSHHHPPADTITATKAIFDSSLSTKTRLLAVFGAVSINFLLPFVNGVMLGFGEIFAKNIIGPWLGWKNGTVRTPLPGSVAASQGIGLQASSKRR